MHFTSKSVYKAYLQLVSIDSREEGKSRQEKVSALRHLLGTSIVLKNSHQSSLDLSVGQTANRESFIKAVGEVVGVVGTGKYTVDFHSKFADAPDYAVGSNFLTTRVANSRNGQSVEYPGRPAPLLDVTDEKVSVRGNLKSTLENEYNIAIIRAPLAVWLLRSEEIQSADGTEPDSVDKFHQIIERAIKSKFDSNVAGAITPSKEEITSFLSGAGLKTVELLGNEIADQTAVTSVSRYPASPGSFLDLRGVVDHIESDFLIAGLRIKNEVIRRFLSSLLAKRFVIITGLSGSGKTKLAHAFASWITGNTYHDDPFIPGAEIKSDRITYIVRRSDNISIEFSNNEEDADETLVSLPRAMIREWASYISKKNLSRDEPARNIREGVSKLSKYSTQLHSFETHLKAAAFTMLEAERSTIMEDCYRVIAVGADWTTNENVVGYQDALQPGIYRKPPSGALDIILRAAREMTAAKNAGERARPYFLILDEMNLSHVERYFADILSAIESGQEIALHSAAEELIASEEDCLPVPQRIRLPENLFIVGTVNVDETTYMFSPKVLDRANVVEFRASEEDIAWFLDNPSKVAMGLLAGKGAAYGMAFVAGAQADVSLDKQVASDLKTTLNEIFVELAKIGAEFGFRTAYEITRFVHFHKMLSGEDWKFELALDAQVLQKLMPKLHGSERKLGPVLEALDAFCEKHGCKASRSKIKRMQDRLKADGFTSFAEA